MNWIFNKGENENKNARSTTFATPMQFAVKSGLFFEFALKREG